MAILEDDTVWDLLATCVTLAWLYPENEAMVPLRESLNVVENENPGIVVAIYDSAERQYKALDTNERHEVDCRREQFAR